jgi:hypothetical protein
MLLKQYGIKPKQQSCMYRTLYPSGYDQILFSPRFKVPDFTKFSGQDEQPQWSTSLGLSSNVEKWGTLMH